MSALRDDEPQFREVTGAAAEAAAAEYKRIWGEDMPTADTTDSDGSDPETAK